MFEWMAINTTPAVRSFAEKYMIGPPRCQRQLQAAESGFGRPDAGPLPLLRGPSRAVTANWRRPDICARFLTDSHGFLHSFYVLSPLFVFFSRPFFRPSTPFPTLSGTSGSYRG